MPGLAGGGRRLEFAIDDADSSLPSGVSYDGVWFARDWMHGASSGLRLLYVFSGPHRKGDVAAWAAYFGASAVCIDIELDPDEHDLLDDVVFERLLLTARSDQFNALLIATPCDTFSRCHGSLTSCVATRLQNGWRDLRQDLKYKV